MSCKRRKLRSLAVEDGIEELSDNQDDIQELSDASEEGGGDSSDNSDVEAAGGGDEVESPDEVRLQMARRLIEKLKAEGDATEDDVAKKLQREIDTSLDRVHHVIADNLQLGPVTFYRGHKLTPTCVAASNSDDFVFTGGKDCAIIKWDIETGQKTVFGGGRKRFDSGGHFEQVLGICVNGTGNSLCSVGVDRHLRIWDHRVATDRCVAAIKGHNARITSICCDPSDTELSEVYTTSDDKLIKTWSISSRRQVDSFHGHTGPSVSIDIASKHRPVSGGEDGTLRWWKMDRGTHLLFDSRNMSPIDSCTAVNSIHAASGSQDGVISLWSASHRKPLCSQEKAHGGNGVSSLACIRSSDVIFSGSHDGSLRVWKSSAMPHEGAKKTTGKSVALSEVNNIPMPGFINGIAISRSRRHLFAAVGKEHRLGRWICDKKASNGLLVLPLEHDAVVD